jgi:hypothetical protein
MSERPRDPYVAPREPTLEAAPGNMAFAWGLFALFVVLFAGTVGVGLVYLALD